MAANNTATTINSSGGERPAMDIRLRKAASCGDSMLMHSMVSKNPDILLGTTQQGNNCLHIASIHGHERFCKDVVELNESLLSDANLYAETPLIVALTRGHPSLARIFLTHCHKVAGLRQSIFQQDNNGCNALHHAIRISREELALDLIAAEPALSEAVNKFNESPLFLAVMRDFNHVFEELLQLPGSAHVGQFGFNALHAAVRNNNPAIARKIMQTRPWLAREGNTGSATPIRMAVYCNKICVLRELLQQDCSMGYEMHRNSSPLLICAAERGHVDVARELLQHCPDAPYCKADKESQTCLHIAVLNNRKKFVEFILGTPHLRKLVNMQDSLGKTALHYAVQKCYPEIVSALLSHEDIDTSILDNKAKSAARELCITPYSAKTINWNEVSMLMVKGSPHDSTTLINIHKDAKQRVIDDSRKDAKFLTATYTTNTSLVAILIVTITFAAAFTLPGGYNSDAGSEGIPIMCRKFAFQTFLVADTLAMCSSFAIAFICIIARWEDYEFLLYYRSITKKLMWFAYVATTTAFSTGLYTVLDPRLNWLAIAICVLVALLPILTKLLGEWPILRLRFRLGKDYKSDLLSMV